jgi:16S rRNA C1402 N4-methylase RsmH
MLREVTWSMLFTSPNGVYVDGTIGTGGHSEAVCEMMSPHGLLIGLDRDEQAIPNLSGETVFHWEKGAPGQRKLQSIG